MASSSDADYQFALRLHQTLNGTSSVISPVPTNSKSNVKKEESRSNIHQPEISTQTERRSPDEYFVPELNSYLNLDHNTDWAFVNFESNIQQMFDRLKNQYWKNWLLKVDYNVQWDSTGILENGTSFKIIENQKGILVSRDAMTRPRIQLISLLMHALIHIYLNAVSNIGMNHHVECFREIMLYLNQKLNTQITTSHKFTHTPEETEYNKCWYKCVGICGAYEPFHGIVRCKMIPDECHAFWKDHEDSCGGQFFKVFEIERFNGETDLLEKKYVRNVKYMYPKAKEDAAKSKGHKKTNIQVRELFDLTEDNDNSEATTVKNLCEVIDLDATDFNLEENRDSSKHVSNFKKLNIKSILQNCPFCYKNLQSLNKFESHVDFCRGYQQKVEFSMKGLKAKG